jgi:hypothetical protein
MLLKGIAIGIVVLIFALVFFDVGLITSRFIKPNLPAAVRTQSEISGVVKINGPIPQGSSISVGVRDHGSTGDYRIFVSGLPAADETAWEYTGAKEGNSYQLQAYLDLNGAKNTVSDPLTVTAPAGEESLTLNIQTPPAPQPQPASISGSVYINGYIPQGATFDILGRKYGSSDDYSPVVENLSATIKRTVTYSNAVSGQKYEILGKLFDSKGTLIGDSNIIVLSAPSDNAELTINSTATPPVGAVTVLQNNTTSQSPAPASTSLPTGSSAISGTINFNGSAPSGSSIVILAAPQGNNTNYQVVVNGITPANGSTWTWNGAEAGKTYNMVAVLKGQQNNQNTDYADSQTYIVSAPAQNQLFTLNTGFSLAAPSGPVFPTCSTHNSNNTWNMTVNFSNVQGAQYYVLQLGSTSGASDIDNVSQAAQSTSNNTQQINATINDSVVYYAQYAVASVPNPTPAQLSPFSGPFTIKCP